MSAPSLLFRHARKLLLLLCGFALIPAQATTPQQDKKPLLLASIKPLALIAQEIAGDHIKVATLLPVTASPHDYPLKASDHRRIHDADIILWVGPELESFLAKPLQNSVDTKVITTYELTSLHWPIPSAGTSKHEHAHQHEHNQDPHLWLDPRNAVVIAHQLALRFSEIAPTHAAEFSANDNRFKQEMETLDKDIAQSLAPVKTIGFGVYHEGYAHFVAHYQLHQVGYVTYTPERRPGAKHIQELRNVLLQDGQCLFMEPQASGSAVTELARSLNLRTGLLDPIGNDDVASYAQLLSNMREQFLACLADRTNQRDM